MGVEEEEEEEEEEKKEGSEGSSRGRRPSVPFQRPSCCEAHTDKQTHTHPSPERKTSEAPAQELRGWRGGGEGIFFCVCVSLAGRGTWTEEVYCMIRSG